MPSLAAALWTAAGAPINAELFGVSVVYSRGVSSVTATAIPSVVDYEAFDVDDGALTTIATKRQYLIAASALDSLAAAGEVFEPRRNDTIAETINGEDCVFRIGPIGGKPAAELQVDGAHWLVRAVRIE